jgi:hypothetical protein
VTGYEVDYWGSVPDRRILLSITMSRPVLGPIAPSIQWIPVIKRKGCEADNSPLPGAGVMI